MKEYPPASKHLPLRVLFPGIWYVSSLQKMSPPPGLAFSRNMVTVKTDDGLVLLNPVRLSDAGEAELLAHGKPRHVVRLGVYHGCDDAYYVDKFGAEFWAVPGRQETYPEPSITREISTGGPLPIPGAQAIVFGEATLPECVIFLPDHRLLVTCDSVQHYEKDPLISVIGKLVMRPMGFFTPCVIGPVWLKAVTPEGGSLRPDFERILELDFDNLVSGHGTPKIGGAKDALRRNVEKLPEKG